MTEQIPNNLEFFEGTRTISHEDGSHTYITYTHEPYVEPLTGKEQAAVLGICAGLVAGVVALPLIVDRGAEWWERRKEIRDLKHRRKMEDLRKETPSE